MPPPWARMKSFLSSSDPTKSSQENFTKAPKGQLFPETNPSIDGEDCLKDCESCTIHYPAKFSIDESDELYGHVRGFMRHIIVATGKTDWVRDVEDEKGSVMEAVGKHNGLVEGKLMLSASNIPTPESPEIPDSTTVILLPAFKIVDNVTPASVPQLITGIINAAPTNNMPLYPPATNSPATTLPSNGTEATDSKTTAGPITATTTIPTPAPAIPPELKLKSRPCPHNHLILLCSQKTRDARCGQSAPLLRREFERHLRPLGLYRDLHDERPGGVGIYFISHVGGHKYSANVMIYRRAGSLGVLSDNMEANGHANGGAMHGDGSEGINGGADDAALATTRESSTEAAQCIWLARVRPEDCENIVKYTVLQGKVVKPERQLRGGFDRSRMLASW